MDESVFRAYDIRGVYPQGVNENIVSRIGYFYVRYFNLKNICVGRDIRVSSFSLFESFLRGAIYAGAHITDLGMISTDMMYFATAFYNFDGGVQITASHNPKEYNGVKMVLSGARPVSGDNGIYEIRDLIKNSLNEEFPFPLSVNSEKLDIKNDYINHVLSFINPSSLSNLTIVADSGNGIAGTILPSIFERLNCKLLSLFFEVDGTFPNRPSEPLPQNLVEARKMVVNKKADFGVAFDGDADRCFFIDNKGECINGYFTTTLLAKNILLHSSGETIVHEVRQIWAIEDVIKEYGGKSVLSRPGHVYIKDAMRENNAIFGGELSSHFYFRENFFADNGMIPMLMIMQLISDTKKSLSSLVVPLFEKYFVSDEINYEVQDIQSIIDKINYEYKSKECKLSFIDGISVEFKDYRFNVRGSNTEPLIRLNMEAKSSDILVKRLEEVEKLIIE
ncbi:phosphomannomutase/phosphoglucomutase [Patescibacteria group bacterium]|nr:phosphomannomutase/phosphoglucomutase [Patescibacteria group bacterium]